MSKTLYRTEGLETYLIDGSLPVLIRFDRNGAQVEALDLKTGVLEGRADLYLDIRLPRHREVQELSLEEMRSYLLERGYDLETLL